MTQRDIWAVNVAAMNLSVLVEIIVVVGDAVISNIS